MQINEVDRREFGKRFQGNLKVNEGHDCEYSSSQALQVSANHRKLNGGIGIVADRKLKGSLADRLRLLCVGALVRTFFRRVEVTGLEHIPRDRGGLLIAWHPNGLIDPGVLTATFPGRVFFGAKHVLFSIPVLGPALRAFGAVPIYRAKDDPSLGLEERRQANAASLAALAERIGQGAYAALFPEGVSHDEPYLAPLKSGAARLYYAARAAGAPGTAPPAIVPVGLHYDEKQLFRSQALVNFYPPLDLPAELDVDLQGDMDDAGYSERVRVLTRLMEEALTETVHPTEDWTTHRLVHRVRKLVRAERIKRTGGTSDRPSISEKVLGFARVQRAYSERATTHPREAARIRGEIQAYDETLTALGLDDHELDVSPPVGGFWLLSLTAIQFAFVFVLLPPLLLLGYVINAPPALVVYLISRRLAEQPNVMATQKLIAGAVLFPLTWLGVVVIGVLGHGAISTRFPTLPDTPVVAGVVLALLSIVGGAHVLRYQTVARQTIKNVRVRFRRARQQQLIATTLATRAHIFDEVMHLAEGLDLPGNLTANGIVRASERS